MFKREGGLRLCVCEHPLAYHPALPAWYYHKGSSDLAKAAPDVVRCSFCECRDPREGEFQGLSWEQAEQPCK